MNAKAEITPLFAFEHAYTKEAILSYTIEEFDLNVLLQNERKGGMRKVSEDIIYKGKSIAGYLATPLFDMELVEMTGYHLVKKESQPIVVGTGIPSVHLNNKHAQCFIATDNYNLLVRLSSIGLSAIYHSDIYNAFSLVDSYLDTSKPRLIATDKDLEAYSDLKVYFDRNVSNISDQEIKKRILEAAKLVKPTEKPKATIQIVSMQDIQAKPIEWLWHGWLPLGKMTILAGAGGCGKTNLSLALIATITTAGKFPDGSICAHSGEVLIYSTEDDPADTLKPRLLANGADVGKVSIISGRTNDKGELEPFDPAKDFPQIEEYIKTHPNIKLLMIDPIVSAVGGDMNKANDVRKSLQPLVDLANEYKFAVLGITHFAKGSIGSTPADRIIGSQAFTALARMAWSAAKRENEGDCILVRAKSNNSVLDGGIRYQIESETVLGSIETTKTAWLGVIEGTARELLNEAESAESDNGSMVDMAKEFLIDLLSSVENMPTKEVQAQAKDAGFSPASIRRAQEKLNIKPFKLKGEKVWFWSLPTIHRLNEPTHF